MPAPKQQSRINIQDLKAQMARRIGPKRADRYFTHFKCYINVRFKKRELDKLVKITIGRENIPLHNQIVKAVLNNATRSKAAPAIFLQDISKAIQIVATNKDDSSRDETSLTTTVSSNGDSSAFSKSMNRPGTLEEKINEDKTNSVEIIQREDDPKKVNNVDLCRPSKEDKVIMEQLDDYMDHISKRRTMDIAYSTPSDTRLRSPSNTEKVLDEKARYRYMEHTRSLLGLPFYPRIVNSGMMQPHVSLPGSSSQVVLFEDSDSSLDSDGLPDLEMLQRQMEYSASSEGLQGVDQEAVAILNEGVDAFLKRLIIACIGFVKSRPTLLQTFGAQRHKNSIPASTCTSEAAGIDFVKSRSNLVQAFGHIHGNIHPTSTCTPKGEDSTYRLQVTENCKEVENNIRPRFQGFDPATLHKEVVLVRTSVSFLDFRAAMELNPQQLGENWPLQLEKILCHSFECPNEVSQ